MCIWLLVWCRFRDAIYIFIIKIFISLVNPYLNQQNVSNSLHQNYKFFYRNFQKKRLIFYNLCDSFEVSNFPGKSSIFLDESQVGSDLLFSVNFFYFFLYTCASIRQCEYLEEWSRRRSLDALFISFSGKLSIGKSFIILFNTEK